MRYHLTSIGMAIINKQTKPKKITSIGKDVEKLEHLCIGGGNVKPFCFCGNGMAIPFNIRNRITV